MRPFALEQAKFEVRELDGDVIARTHETAHRRETGEVAYERDFAVRLTFDAERIVRVVVMPAAMLPSQFNRPPPRASSASATVNGSRSRTPYARRWANALWLVDVCGTS